MPKDSEKAQRLREKKERKLYEAQVKQSNEKVAEARLVLEQILKATNQPNYQKAIGILDSAIELHPENFEAFITRGNARRDQFLLDEAIDDYTKATELFANAHAAYEGRATCFELLRDYDKAIQDYTTIISIHPENDHAYNMRGAALLKKRPQGLLLKEADYAAVVSDFKTALRLNEHNFHARTNLGKAHSDQRKFRDAIDCFTLALKSNETYRYANYRRACANIALATELQREVDRFSALLASKKKQLAVLASGGAAAGASVGSPLMSSFGSSSGGSPAGSGANAAKKRVLLGLRVERLGGEDALASPQDHVATEDRLNAAAAERTRCLTAAVADLNKVIDKEHKNLEITAVVHLANCYFDLGTDDAAALAEYTDALNLIPSDEAAMSANALHMQNFMNANGGGGGALGMTMGGTMSGGLGGTFSGTMSILSATQVAMGSAMMAAPLGDTALLRQVISSRMEQLAARKESASLHNTHASMGHMSADGSSPMRA